MNSSPIEPISENGKPAENLGHLGAQPEDRLLIKWSRAAPGQRDDLEARSGHGAQPLGDDDGQAVPAGQPRHVVNKDQGFGMGQVKVVEQQHSTRVLCRRGDEELAYGHEPALTRRREATFEGSLDLGSTPGRYKIEQPGVPLDHLVESLGDTPVGTGAGDRRTGPPDSQRLPAGSLRDLVEELRLPRPGCAHDLDRRSDPVSDVADHPKHPTRRIHVLRGGCAVCRRCSVARTGGLGLLGHIGDEPVATAVNRLDDPLISTSVANRAPGGLDPAGQRRLGDEPVPQILSRSSVFGTTRSR